MAKKKCSQCDNYCDERFDICYSCYAECPNCGMEKEYPQYKLCKDCYYSELEEEMDEAISNSLSIDLSNVNTDEASKKINKNTYEYECLTCTEKILQGYLCKDCYTKMHNIKNTLDKNMNNYEVRDYYYNFKNYIFNKSWSQNTGAYLKLYAIATLANEIHKDNALIKRVTKDISDITKNYEAHNASKEILDEEKEEKENSKRKDKQEIEKEKKVGYLRSLDGHFVKSDGERMVDDILYNADILHVYQKRVIDITERIVTCDWFIPVINKSTGIYIEYWGMENDIDYDDNKREKQELYAKHNLKLIEINPNDIKGDSQWLNDNLISEIKKNKKELFDRYHN